MVCPAVTTIGRALAVLRKEGERFSFLPDGGFLINGVRQTRGEIISYANDLVLANDGKPNQMREKVYACM